MQFVNYRATVQSAEII